MIVNQKVYGQMWNNITIFCIFKEQILIIGRMGNNCNDINSSCEKNWKVTKMSENSYMLTGLNYSVQAQRHMCSLRSNTKEQINIYQWRRNNKGQLNVLQLYYYEITPAKDITEICSGIEEKKVNVYTEAVQPIQQFNHTISPYLGLQLLADWIQAAITLKDKFGLFRIKTKMVVINQQKVGKLWIHSNYAKNQTEIKKYSNQHHDRTMVDDICSIVKDKISLANQLIGKGLTQAKQHINQLKKINRVSKLQKDSLGNIKRVTAENFQNSQILKEHINRTSQSSLANISNGEVFQKGRVGGQQQKTTQLERFGKDGCNNGKNRYNNKSFLSTTVTTTYNYYPFCQLPKNSQHSQFTVKPLNPPNIQSNIQFANNNQTSVLLISNEFTRKRISDQEAISPLNNLQKDNRANNALFSNANGNQKDNSTYKDNHKDKLQIITNNHIDQKDYQLIAKTDRKNRNSIQNTKRRSHRKSKDISNFSLEKQRQAIQLISSVTFVDRLEEKIQDEITVFEQSVIIKGMD